MRCVSWTEKPCVNMDITFYYSVDCIFVMSGFRAQKPILQSDFVLCKNEIKHKMNNGIHILITNSWIIWSPSSFAFSQNEIELAKFFVLAEFCHFGNILEFPLECCRWNFGVVNFPIGKRFSTNAFWFWCNWIDFHIDCKSIEPMKIATEQQNY